jgi:hypothetical protein
VQDGQWWEVQDQQQMLSYEYDQIHVMPLLVWPLYVKLVVFLQNLTKILYTLLVPRGK